MATLTIDLPSNAGEFLRALGKRITEISYDIPDQTPTGATNVLTVDSDANGAVSVQVTSGAYPTEKQYA